MQVEKRVEHLQTPRSVAATNQLLGMQVVMQGVLVVEI
jgi:hypothetical protein